MRRAEAEYLLAAFQAAGGNRRKAAEIAGLHYVTFVRKFAALRVEFVPVLPT